MNRYDILTKKPPRPTEKPQLTDYDLLVNALKYNRYIKTTNQFTIYKKDHVTPLLVIDIASEKQREKEVAEKIQPDFFKEGCIDIKVQEELIQRFNIPEVEITPIKIETTPIHMNRFV